MIGLASAQRAFDRAEPAARPGAAEFDSLVQRMSADLAADMLRACSKPHETAGEVWDEIATDTDALTNWTGAFIVALTMQDDMNSAVELRNVLRGLVRAGVQRLAEVEALRTVESMDDEQITGIETRRFAFG